MKCSHCERDAVDRCFTCGQLFCEDHGAKNCVSCQNAFVEGDPSPQRVSANRQRVTDAAAWWRPQPAEEFAPPACHICKGLSRAICRDCGRRYCANHTGGKFICQSCVSTADPSILIIGGFLLVCGLVLFIAYLAS